MATKASALDSTKKRQTPGVALVSEHDDRAALRDGLEQQDARRRRTTRKVPREESLITTQRPLGARAHARLKCDERVEEQERCTVR